MLEKYSLDNYFFGRVTIWNSLPIISADGEFSLLPTSIYTSVLLKLNNNQYLDLLKNNVCNVNAGRHYVGPTVSYLTPLMEFDNQYIDDINRGVTKHKAIRLGGKYSKIYYQRIENDL